MTSLITATEAGKSLSDLVNRICYHGETFLITSGGEEVARLSAATSAARVTLRDLVDRLKESRTGDPSFADELEEIQARQSALPDDERVA